MAAYSEKSGVYKVKQGGILKPALLCRDYLITGCSGQTGSSVKGRLHI